MTDPIYDLRDREIFVFGSNLAGRHGKGAALYALKHHGATRGVGYGLQGDAFAIPTKNMNIKTLPLEEIELYVHTFLFFAKRNNNLTFNVTRIGCGLAGYTDKDIAPMFKDATDNVVLPTEWNEFVGSK